MSSELAQPLSMGEIVRNKVRETLFNSIPDEEIDKLIKKEYESFFEDVLVRNYSGQVTGTSPSLFKTLVHAELKLQLKPIISEMLKKTLSEDYNPETGTGGYKVSQEIVKKMAPELFDALLQGFASRALQAVKDSAY